MDDAEPAHPSPRLRRWLCITLASSLIIALVAVPLWRYCWHQEYRRLLLSFSPSSRDSYHDPAPWSFAARLPPSWRTAFLRLRTVDIGANNKRPLSAADLRRLHSAVKYRQFGLGIQRLCLAKAEPAVFDGLAPFKDLLYLRLQDCHLPENLGTHLKALQTLNVVDVSIAPHERQPQVASIGATSVIRFGRYRPGRTVEIPEDQRRALQTLWQVTQLERVVIRSGGFLDVQGGHLWRLSELHTLELHTGLNLETLDQFASLPSLRKLDLSGSVPVEFVDQNQSWEDLVSRLRITQRPEVVVVPPRFVTALGGSRPQHVESGKSVRWMKEKRSHRSGK